MSRTDAKPFLKGLLAITIACGLGYFCFKLMAALMPFYDLGVS